MKYRLPLAVTSAALFAVLFSINGFAVGKTEPAYVLFALAACSVILHNDEEELLMIGQMQLARIFLIRFAASVISVSALPIAMILLFTKERRPLKMAIAFFVLVLVISAIGAFFRVLLKSTAVSMIFSLLLYIALMLASEREIFPLFYSVRIADMQSFYWNRLIWFGVSVALLGVSVLVLRARDSYGLFKRK